MIFDVDDPELRQSPNSGAVDSYSGAVEGIFVDLNPDSNLAGSASFWLIWILIRVSISTKNVKLN